jgi:ATP-dependent Lhr-like helicase
MHEGRAGPRANMFDILCAMPTARFHPAVAAWFERTFSTATEPQRLAWPAIERGDHTLIAAPTGSGKTLAAFLAAIDDLVKQSLRGDLPAETQVVYVSPLKALSNDIERNLQQPLAGIRAELKNRGLPEAEIRVQVRTGDTSQADRAAMRKTPPHILVTTPESLYLLLTSESGRTMLATTRSVIVDEIHAVAGTKRGAHLALSLERLAALASRRIPRIGLSATQKPIEEVARFLVGADTHANGQPNCAIIDTGHVRARDLAIGLPRSPLQAVMASEVWEELYDRLAQLIQEHRTTLIFVNTRRLAERATRHLSERIGKEHITSHHGSLAKESRFDAEQRLKRGELKALVATASLELGIDIGDVDLVIQLGSPRSIATFLQRVGRSGHTVSGTPKGRLFPLTRDEMIESAALLDAVARGELDRLRIPAKPLDVLAQQIVAEVAGRDWSEQALYERFRRAYPYRDLAYEEYMAVVRMLADGFSTRRGRRSAYLHRDAVNGQLRARKGTRLTALTCGGAIPDNADYRVVLEPSGIPVGTLNEDFAIESMTGDIFQLGNTSYRILKVEPGIVRVDDAKGAPPTIPFWLGEAPARTDELSAAVSRMRDDIGVHLGAHLTAESLQTTRTWLATAYRLDATTAEQIIDYLAAAKGVLGTVPTQQTVVLERFFDETGGMQLVIHAPFGNRINRAWGLALRKRFCRKFNFELQAAATEDAIVLSLGETHSFPIDEVARYLHSATVHDLLVQALLDAPVFTTRWRWTASIALAVKRFRGGRKNPAPLQRMDAEDLIAVVFPDQIACAENLAAEREIPDHPLVRQTIDDCLHEAMDVDGLIALLQALERGEVRVLARDLPHPSPLAQEILNAKPYAFLDDAPLEERRTQAVMSRRWLDPLEAGELGRLDPEAIARVRAEAWPEVAAADELHDALMLLGYIEEREGQASGWGTHLEELIAARRATRLRAPNATYWVAAEQLPLLRALHPDAQAEPAIEVPTEFTAREWTREAALVEIVRNRLQGLGPVTVDQLAASLGATASETQTALLALESEGFVLRGQFNNIDRISEPTLPLPPGEGWGEGERAELSHPSPSFPLPQGEREASRGAESTRTELNTEWCERRLLARIHRYTVDRLRAEIEPVTAADFLRFLFEWQGVTSEPRAEGPQALAAIIEQLEGFEAAGIAWESEILRARMQGYDPDWLDDLCRSGRVVWARLTPPKTNGGERATGPVRSTPITLLPRRDLRYWQTPATKSDADLARPSSRAQAVADYLEQHGASFFEEITSGTGLLKSETEEALGELVALGRLQADSFSGLRALLLPADKRRSASRRRRVANAIEDAGRWSLLRASPSFPLLHDGDVQGRTKIAGDRKSGAIQRVGVGASDARSDESAEHIARALLRRYGVVFRKLVTREQDELPPWIDLLRVYRRLEARGEIRGGRFVAGFSGEQYALPEAVPMLRAVRRKPKNEQWVSLSAADPLNLVGIVTPGGRVPALAGNRVLYRDGVPVAVQVGGKAEFLIEVPDQQAWNARNALIRGVASASSAAH